MTDAAAKKTEKPEADAPASLVKTPAEIIDSAIARIYQSRNWREMGVYTTTLRAKFNLLWADADTDEQGKMQKALVKATEKMAESTGKQTTAETLEWATDAAIAMADTLLLTAGRSGLPGTLPRAFRVAATKLVELADYETNAEAKFILAKNSEKLSRKAYSFT